MISQFCGYETQKVLCFLRVFLHIKNVDIFFKLQNTSRTFLFSNLYFLKKKFFFSMSRVLQNLSTFFGTEIKCIFLRRVMKLLGFFQIVTALVSKNWPLKSKIKSKIKFSNRNPYKCSTLNLILRFPIAVECWWNTGLFETACSVRKSERSLHHVCGILENN